MKLLFYFIVFVPSILFSQFKIEGYVYDESGESIVGSSIYVDGTTFRTTSNEFGFFSLQIPIKSNSILVFSNYGYKSEYIELQKVSGLLKITLKREVKELKEVVIEKNIFSRKQMMQLFKSQFLGENKAGKNCIIQNEDKIYFNYDKKNYQLNAYSDEPLIITNNYLGYKINYQLKDFQCRLSKLSVRSEFVISCQYGGFSIFEEINMSDQIEKRRQQSFEGSSLHFFRNLIENKWNDKNFILFKGSFPTDPKEHFEITYLENNIYKVDVISKTKIEVMDRYITQFNVLYNKKKQSKVMFYISNFYVDFYGVYSNYENILFSGEISKQRIGDLLPTDYNK